MKIAIIGTGVYGIAMAIHLQKNNKNQIMMWSESSASLQHIEGTRSSYAELEGLCIPQNISFSNSYQEVLEGAQIVFIMCAAKYVSSVAKEMKPYIKDTMHFVIGSKGIEQTSCLFAHEVFLHTINTKNIALISGPSFAIDIARLEPIGLSIASESKKTLAVVKNVYKDTNIKLRETSDLVGVAICGSIKNVIAVAAGILNGLGYTESTRSFLITESLHDIKELIFALKGNKMTILSFAGLGDLLLTATSEKSRNYTFGTILGKDGFKKANHYLETTTVEGYYTLKSIYQLLKSKRIKMPVIDLVYKIVMDGECPQLLTDFLLNKK